MKYRADYMRVDDSRGATRIIYADNDQAAHELALMHIPDGMELHSVYRVEVRDYERRELRKRIAILPKYGFGEWHDTMMLLLNALDEADIEKAALQKAAPDTEGGSS